MRSEGEGADDQPGRQRQTRRSTSSAPTSSRTYSSARTATTTTPASTTRPRSSSRSPSFSARPAWIAAWAGRSVGDRCYAPAVTCGLVAGRALKMGAASGVVRLWCGSPVLAPVDRLGIAEPAIRARPATRASKSGPLGEERNRRGVAGPVLGAFRKRTLAEHPPDGRPGFEPAGRAAELARNLKASPVSHREPSRRGTITCRSSCCAASPTPTVA